MTQRKLMLTALAVVLAVGVTAVPALAYFTAHTEAVGNVPISLGTTTTITEDLPDPLTKVVTINNQGPEACWVRVKAYSAYPLEYTPGENWKENGDYFDYTEILEAGDDTTALTVKVTPPADPKQDENFNVIVVYEATPVTYDENGEPETPPDWDAKVIHEETVTESQEGGE